MSDYLLRVDNMFILIYLVILIISIYSKNKSLKTVAIILFSFELIMKLIHSKLLEFAESLTAPGAYMAWFGTWIAIQSIALIMLSMREKNRTSRCVAILKTYYAALITTTTIGFINEVYIQSEFIRNAYQFAIPSLNTLIAIQLIIEIVRLKRCYSQYSQQL